jgi:DNA-binding NarL/FixJ family response regulator
MTISRVVIVDDHPLFRGALGQALAGAMPDARLSEAGSLDELDRILATGEPVDLVLFDLMMPGVKGLSGLLWLRAEHPTVPVVVVSANERPGIVHQCLEIGASGFIPKSLPVDRIREAVRAVLAGEVWLPENVVPPVAEDETSKIVARLATLTPQQLRVLMMLAEGLLNKQIAFALSVSEATVKAHVSAILQKLDVDSRTQAVIAINKIDLAEHSASGA